MSSKYLSSGTAVWTADVRTISGATMTPVFESADETYQRQVFFRIGTGLYFGRIERFVSATSIILLKFGNLPATDGTVNTIFLYDLSESHSYQDYIDELQSKIKDEAEKLTTTDGGDLDALIAESLSTYSKHRFF